MVSRVRHWPTGRSCLRRRAARAAIAGHAICRAGGNRDEYAHAHADHRPAHGATVFAQRRRDAPPHATRVYGDTDAAGDDNARPEGGAPHGNAIGNRNTVDYNNATGDSNVTSDGNTRTDGDAPFGYRPAATSDTDCIRISFAAVINADPAPDDDTNRGNEHADGHTDSIGNPDG